MAPVIDGTRYHDVKAATEQTCAASRTSQGARPGPVTTYPHDQRDHGERVDQEHQHGAHRARR
jgi:hypothetical protein